MIIALCVYKCWTLTFQNTPDFVWGSCGSIVFCVLFCGPLFVLFTFYFIVSLGMVFSICLHCRPSGYACGIPKLFTTFWQFTNIETSFLRTKYSRLKWYQHKKSDGRNYKLDIYKFETIYISPSISLQGKYSPSPISSGF